MDGVAVESAFYPAPKACLRDISFGADFEQAAVLGFGLSKVPDLNQTVDLPSPPFSP